jgi:predicted RNase H-like nuclease
MFMMGRGRHSPNLPYEVVAGVIPCEDGWLVASAKLQGVTIAPELPRMLGSFMDVLDERPAFSVVGLHAPVGLLDHPVQGGRTCEREARALLGRRTAGYIRSAPARTTLNGNGHAVDVGSAALAHRYAEVAQEMGPYRQRTVFEVHPELSFYQLNGDQPLEHTKRSAQGRQERHTLLEARIPGVERILEARLKRVRRHHLLDATACLWTARRILGRAMTRLPMDPEWDSQGLRMEFVR